MCKERNLAGVFYLEKVSFPKRPSWSAIEVFAWRIGDMLLQHNADMESSYFGAQTLRTKVQSSFTELPAEAHSSLRESLINHLKNTNEKTNSVVITQLCLALADLALQMPSWTNPIDDLLHSFTDPKNPSTNNLYPLLEVLSVIPEEVQHCRHLKLGANRRSEVRLLMSKSSTSVLRFLEATIHLQVSDQRMHNVKVLRCFKAWITTQVAPVDIWGHSSVLSFAFEILRGNESSSLLHEAASDAICSFLEELVECSNVPSHLKEMVVLKCKQLSDAYHMAVAGEDSDKAVNYCRVFTHTAESMLYDILGDNDVAQPKYMELLDMIIGCCGHPEYEVAEITFGFWYKLSEEVYRRNMDSFTEIYRTHIERLLYCLKRHAQIEPDHEGVLEDSDEFSDFRKRIVDLVKDVIFMVGSTSVFKQCCMSLQGASWETTEAGLFMMAAVSRNLLPDENEVVPGVLQAILHLPHEVHVCVRHTSIQLIAEMSEWIDHHQEYLDPVLNFLIGHLRDQRLARVAAVALESICGISRDKLVKHFDGLLQLVKGLDSYPISNEAAVNILKGVATVLSRLPEGRIEPMLLEVCKQQTEPLKNLVNSQSIPEKGKHSDPSYWLDCLAAVFRHLSITSNNGNSHPCQAAMVEIWPVLSAVAQKYQSDRRICERMCRCLRFGLRCLGRFSAPLIGSIVKQITELYSQHPHSCFLYLGSILVDEYAGDKSCAQGFLNMLESFLGPAYALLEKPNGLRDNPDTVDDLFRLCTRLLQRYPAELLGSRVFSSLLECSLLAATLDHRDACSSVMKFLSVVVYFAYSKSTSGHESNDEDSQRTRLAQGILQSHGATIVSTILNASIFQLSSYSIHDVAEVLYAFASGSREGTGELLRNAFASLPRTTGSGCATATDEQLHTFLQKAVKSTSSKEISKALREFVRLFR